MFSRRLLMETLESRELPASFGVPWANSDVTLSYLPDGSSVSTMNSNLQQSLGQDFSEEEWKREILLAFQKWSEVSDLSIGVVRDNGAALGSTGRWQSDSRFGDIRIGGANLGSNQLAIGTPSDPGLAGTRAGDILLNTGYSFKESYDLHSVFLHEAGHSLGLGNSSNPVDAMYSQYIGQRTTLSARDISAIRALYGERQPDQHEPNLGNHVTNRAANLGLVDNRSTIQLVYGDLTTNTDVDLYSFLTPNQYGQSNQDIQVKLQTAGLSLLNAKVRVYFLENGNEVEVANATIDPKALGDGETTVKFSGNDDDDDGQRQYFIRVERADDTDFGIGKYAIGVSYLENDQFDSANLLTLEGGVRPVLLNNDTAGNDTLTTATALAPTSVSSVLPKSRSEALASFSAVTDKDVYRIKAPTGTGNRVLTVNTQVLDGLDSGITIEVLTASGQTINTSTLTNINGTRTVQVDGLTPGATYFVRLAASELGNYRLTADFTTQTTNMATFADGSLPVGTTSITDTLYIARAQLMQFNLGAVAANAPVGTAVRMTFLDAANNTILSVQSNVGDVNSTQQVLLRPGEYRVRIELIHPGWWSGDVRIIITGNRLDDPIGARPTDPTFNPTYPHPFDPGKHWFPGGTVSINPFYWLTLLR
jgi:hypothetical protein